jgi:hypothetical protein
MTFTTRTRIVAVLFAAPCCALAIALRADDSDNPWDLDPRFGEWKTLFNGKDLSGWQTAKPAQAGGQNLWVVEDGALTNVRGGVNDICTVEEWSDYELVLEYKLPEREKPDAANGNSGVYLRGTCEIQVYDSYGTSDKDLSNADAGAIYGVGYVPLTNVQKKPGEWNRFRVIHVGHRITVYHNDVLIQDNVYQDRPTGGAMSRYPTGDKHPLTGEKGPLMLQGDHTKVWYRNIRIRPLCAGPGWRPLWNGKDLSEFTARGDSRAKDGLRWEVRDNAFTNKSQGGSGHDIWTKESFGNFLVFYQYKGDTGRPANLNLEDASGNSGFYLRDQWEIQVHSPGGDKKAQGKHGDASLYSYHAPARISHNGDDRWNTMCVRLVGNAITVWQNGILIHDKVVLPTRTDNHGEPTKAFSTAPFKLQGDHGKVWFTNLRILPLPDDAKE